MKVWRNREAQCRTITASKKWKPNISYTVPVGWTNSQHTRSRAYTKNISRTHTKNISRAYTKNISRTHTKNISRAYTKNISRTHTKNISRTYTKNISRTDTKNIFHNSWRVTLSSQAMNGNKGNCYQRETVLFGNCCFQRETEANYVATLVALDMWAEQLARNKWRTRSIGHVDR